MRSAARSRTTPTWAPIASTSREVWDVKAGRSAARIACSSGSMNECVENDSTRIERSSAGITIAAPEYP